MLLSILHLKTAYHQISLRETETKCKFLEVLYEFVVLPLGGTNGVPASQRFIDNVITQAGLKDTFPYLDNVTVAGVDQAGNDRNVVALLQMTKRQYIALNTSNTPTQLLLLTYLEIELVTTAFNQILNDYDSCRNIYHLQKSHLYVEFRHICTLCKKDSIVFR